MEKKWALITGCNRGIGEKILEKFAREGYCVYAHARKHTEAFEEKLARLRVEYDTDVVSVCFDLTDSTAMEEKMRELIRNKAKIDVLVNNAGIMHQNLFQLTEMQTIREVFDVNLFAMMELTQWVLKLMLRKKAGSIVNISSVGGLDLNRGMCAYGVSKAAVAAFTRTLADEAALYGIRVNAVAPGFVNTEMAEIFKEQREDKPAKGSAGGLRRFAEPEEIADAVYYLASEQASYISGQILRVDGGARNFKEL